MPSRESTYWDVDCDDLDEPIFCECGVTLLDGEDMCAVCRCAPHGRDCPCDECVDYWERVCRESAEAAAIANRALVCSCGWTGAFIEHHHSGTYGPAARAGCVLTFRDPDRSLPKRWTGTEWEEEDR